MRVWKLGRLHSYLKALLPSKEFRRAGNYLSPRPLPRLISTFATSFIVAFFLLGIFHSVASAQIVLDGIISEPDWTKLGDSTGGPPSSFGAGNEINALYTDIDAT